MEELRLSLLKLINLFNKVVDKRSTRNLYSYTLVMNSSKTKLRKYFHLEYHQKVEITLE